MLIREFLPNPEGRDTEGEYIVLLNDSQESVDLAGWQIKDLSGKIFRLSGRLESSQELKLFYSTTKIALNNNGETLYLIDPSGALVHELGYTGTAAEGRVVSQIIELSEEIREKLFESPPNNLSFISPSIPLPQLLLFMVLAAAILAGLAVWVLKKFPSANNESPTNERITTHS